MTRRIKTIVGGQQQQPGTTPSAQAATPAPAARSVSWFQWFETNKQLFKNAAMGIACLLILLVIYNFDQLKGGGVAVLKHNAVLAFWAAILIAFYRGGSPKKLLTAVIVFLAVCLIFVFFGTSPQKAADAVSTKTQETVKSLSAVVLPAAKPAVEPKPAVPVSTPAVKREVRGTVVHFNPDEPVSTGLTTMPGDIIQYSGITAPFKVANSTRNGYHIVASDGTYVANHKGEVVLHGYKQEGSVRVKVTSQR